MITNYKGIGNKNILIISGVHGDEKTPLSVTNKINTFIDEFPQNFKELTILHEFNEEAIKANKRFVNDFDVNRAFNGKNDNHPLIMQLINEINNADIIIDIHSSKSCMELIAIDNTPHGKCFCDFADAIDIPYLIHQGNEATIKRYCLSINKPCFTVEVNRLGEIDEESASRGFDMVSKMVGSIDQLNFQSSNEIPLITKCFTTKENCVILPLVNTGDIIQPNQKIAIKIDSKGNSKYILSKEEKPCSVLCANYIDFKTDSNILNCNKQKDVTLFSIS
jgi:succinylglutamate desuccinylase